MGFFNYKLLDGYAINAANGYSFTSPWTDLKQVYAYSISFQFTGSPSGSLVLQASNESDLGIPGNIIGGTSAVGVNALNSQPQNNGLDAVNIVNASATVTAAGNFLFDIGVPGHRWVRAVYTATSGTATVNMWVHAKID